MIKIIGHTNGATIDPLSGDFIEYPDLTKNFKRYGLRAKLFYLKCQFLCDWVEVKIYE